MKIRISQNLLNGLFGRLRVGQKTRSYLLYERDKKGLYQLSKSCFDNETQWQEHLQYYATKPDIAITARYSAKQQEIVIAIFTNIEGRDPQALFIGTASTIEKTPNRTLIIKLAPGCFLESEHRFMVVNCCRYIKNHFGLEYNGVEFRTHCFI